MKQLKEFSTIMSNQSYKELGIPYFKEVFDCIDEVMKTLDVRYYLIGVNAIALELLKQNIKPARGTKDIDFAVMVSSMEEYSQIVSELEKRGFRKVSAPWTFYSENYNVAIDLLPFGEIEESDTIRFSDRHVDLHMLGFREILERAVEVQIEESIINIPPLPGMVLLKLIAWSDRPEDRENDLADILKILQHYFDHSMDEILEYHFDLLENEPFDRMIIAAEVLGRKCRQYLERSRSVEERVLNVLRKELEESSRSAIAMEWARILDKDIEYAFSLLSSFLKGIIEDEI